MTPERITSLGDELYDAWREHRTVAPLVEREPDITINHAYFIQLRFVERRVAAGERIVGKKIGVTSKAVQAMVGVSQPDFGQLTSGIVHDGGLPLQLDALIQPKAEAEVAFVLKHDLRGPGITTTDVIRATDYVVPCFEIVDSRIANWNIKIQDTIAAVQGGSVNAVVWLANTLGRLGIPFLAGEVILSGSQPALVPVAGRYPALHGGRAWPLRSHLRGWWGMTLSLVQIETLAKRLLDAQDQAAAILQISNGIAANLNRSTRK